MRSDSLTSQSNPSAEKWDRRYREASGPGDPTPILAEHLHLLPTHGDALDLACGLGANALLLAQKGLATQGWDISAVALQRLQSSAQAQGLTITTRQQDIEAHPPPPRSFDVIVVTDFLFRPICPAIAAALRPGGLLFYSTWCAGKRSASGPSNPEFLLQPNELLRLFPSLHVRFYREDAAAGTLTLGDRDRAHLITQQPA